MPRMFGQNVGNGESGKMDAKSGYTPRKHGKDLSMRKPPMKDEGFKAKSMGGDSARGISPKLSRSFKGENSRA